jgi:hypothetical protein
MNAVLGTYRGQLKCIKIIVATKHERRQVWKPGLKWDHNMGFIWKKWDSILWTRFISFSIRIVGGLLSIRMILRVTCVAGNLISWVIINYRSRRVNSRIGFLSSAFDLHVHLILDCPALRDVCAQHSSCLWHVTDSKQTSTQQLRKCKQTLK